MAVFDAEKSAEKSEWKKTLIVPSATDSGRRLAHITRGRGHEAGAAARLVATLYHSRIRPAQPASHSG